MRKVFLDNLPKWKVGRNKGCFNWQQSIGYKVEFIYDDIKGEIEIIDYIKNKIKTKYKNIIYIIRTTEFVNCKISYCIGIKTNDYKHKIGDIIKTKTGKIKILECFRIKDIHHKSGEKYYKYKCLIDGNIDKIMESHIDEGIGCNVCSNKKIVKGINDISTTAPWMIKYFVDRKDAFNYSCSSKKKILMKCPICGYKKRIQIDTLNRQGFGCNKCGDGISYPNKFIFNVLQQLLSMNFETEKYFEWSKNKRYDFYFKLNNELYIIEANGLQHYNGGFERKKGRSLEEEQENDKLKKELALVNNIKEENYIVIDCRYSELKFIKNNILHSKLNEFFDLSKIDWLKCHEFALSSRIKEICNLWNDGMKSTLKIAITLKVSRGIIINSLKKGRLLNWCDYNPRKELEKGLIKATNISKKINCKKIICLNTNEIFESIVRASKSKKYKYTSCQNIVSCLKGRNNTAGILISTKEPLKWMYYDDYIKLKDNINILHNKNGISI